ncbi:MAG: phosphomannomutase, partial [Bacteroidota bacterium]|nr:phosphomannomutase [Bacteroidota bacterium]
YGMPIGEELTICISADAALSNVKFFSETNKSSLVINHSTTRLADDIAEKYGTEVFRSPVGEINVVNKMKESNALIGGEGSGGVILPALHYGRDSLAGISLVLLRLAQTGLTLSELKASYPVYTMIKTKMPFSGSILAIIEKFKRLFNDAEILIEDGMKAIYKDRWIQIRTSNTEPIIRIISEAPNEKNAGDLIQLASGIIK